MERKFRLRYRKTKSLVFKIQVFREKKIKPCVENRNYNKVFCVGFNKTGTTTVEEVLSRFGFRLGNQVVAESFAKDVSNGDFERLIKYCHLYDAFQDVPFSVNDTYGVMDQAFPNSKFILTIRDDENQWFSSLVNFHTKLFSSNKSELPSKDDLANSLYIYKGYILDFFKWFLNYPNVSLYNEKEYKEMYLNHIDNVKSYFKDRSNQLLVLNVADKGAYHKLAQFLDIKVNSKDTLPWVNKT